MVAFGKHWRPWVVEEKTTCSTVLELSTAAVAQLSQHRIFSSSCECDTKSSCGTSKVAAAWAGYFSRTVCGYAEQSMQGFLENIDKPTENI